MSAKQVLATIFFLVLIRALCASDLGTPNGPTGSRGAGSAPSETPSPTLASWYGERERGRPTASGERFNPDSFTCASWRYPFGTWLRVTCGDRAVVVRCNDRGPSLSLHRGIDLSKAAFKQLADTRRGLITVTITKL